MALLEKRIKAFADLSEFLMAVTNKQKCRIPENLQSEYDYFQQLIPQLYDYNGWFTEEFVRYQLKAIAQATTYENLMKWLAPYIDDLRKIAQRKTIAVIMAGNIPFVGFSDFIAVLIAGYRFVGKLSSKDTHLPKAIAEVLIKLYPQFKNQIIFTEERLTEFDFDAVIATGSDNTARYFEYYFGKYPNIIRRNRTSVAVLTGAETDWQLEALADDIFLYFGLGCRNVSKIFLPEGFELDRLFKAFYKYRHIINYHKYANNYEYNRAIYLIDKVKFYDNGFVLLKPEDIALVSPTAVVYYQYYKDINTVKQILEAYRDKIQCVVSDLQFEGFDTVAFGQSQNPMLWQYPDGIDVMKFLISLQTA